MLRRKIFKMPSPSSREQTAEGGRKVPYKSQEHHQRSPVTTREIEVLALLALGLSNEQIAEKLGIAPSTVDFFLGSVKLKTRLNNRVLLAFYAYGKGYVNEAAIKAAMLKQRQHNKLGEKAINQGNQGNSEEEAM
jgi:DNA-binding CsgD family transcriptional regulator